MPTPPKKDVRKQEVEDVKAVMGTPAGRRFVYRLLDKSGLYQTVFRPRDLVQPDLWPIFNGAQRDLGQWLCDEVGNCAPSAFDVMMAEKKEQRLLERIAAQNQPAATEDGE